MLWIVIGGVVLLAAAAALVRFLAETPPAAGSKPGTLAWEAEQSKAPLTLTIMNRLSEQKAATDPARLAALQAEIAFLSTQVDEIERVVAQAGATPGRGYVGFDVYGSAESSWAKAMGGKEIVVGGRAGA